MGAVPEPARDDRLLEWWARHDLARGNWREVLQTIDRMSPAALEDSRWRYWKARALLETGATESGRGAAGRAGREKPVTTGSWRRTGSTCPTPFARRRRRVAAEAIDGLGAAGRLRPGAGVAPGGHRQLGARRGGRWPRTGVDKEGLRAAAALAVSRGLAPDGHFRAWRQRRSALVRMALSAGLRAAVDASANGLRLDASWVMGLMRSESALAADAVSPAGAPRSDAGDARHRPAIGPAAWAQLYR